MWIARDQNERVYLYREKPTSKVRGKWIIQDSLTDITKFVEINEEDLPKELCDISWSDKEPKEVKLISV